MAVAVAALILAVPSLARATSLKEFSLPSGQSPGSITAGPDGNAWFTTTNPSAIGRIAPDGTITTFTSSLNGGSTPGDIVLGPDGNLWFGDTGATKAIGRITPSGTITEFTAAGAPEVLTPGPDGNVWFLDIGTKKIGRVTPSGTITEFGTGLNPVAQPNDLTVGPDGNLWFTDQGNTRAIGRITPSGTITEFPTPNATSFPNLITAGGDGNVYYTDDGTPAIGRVTPSGTITELTSGLPATAQPDSIALGPDGNVWFVDQYSGQRAIGRVTPSGTIEEFTAGLNTDLPNATVVGADGNLWFPQSMNGAVARSTTSGTITEFTSGLSGTADLEDMVAGPDGNLWFTDTSSSAPAIGKVSLEIAPTASTGAVSAITSSTAAVAGSVNTLGTASTVTVSYGTTPALGSTASAGQLPASATAAPVSAGLSGLPAGTVIFYRVDASNPFGAAQGSVQSFTTKAAPPVPPPQPGPGLPQTTKATFENQQITLVTPSLKVCTASKSSLRATLRSSAIARSRATKLKFVSAAFFLDKGIKHTTHKTKRVHGKKRKVTVVTYTANATVRHLPATLSLRLKGLKSGRHTLKVVLTYKKTVTSHGHRKTKQVTKTVTAKFLVC
jgi:streptogramin lyase